ncbi:phospholipase D-like domain-containing protein [Falsirhodobacter algicola]|uniref:phospholipase D-like domain-containing protein n=1 Tax=Falsirhodobacter algicola TaxID=2692330 RepID=UPI002010E325|nr:phospholipase D family protein [Falsirhodobacter algicola]
MFWLVWLIAITALFFVLSALAFRAWTRWAERARGHVSHVLPRTGPPTPMDALADRIGPGTGALGLTGGREAFAARLQSIRMAGRSIDLMYYIWRNDLTGSLLLAELMRAADRGVRVRLLLDDINAQGFGRTLLALNQHPGVEIRLFNPTRSRGHILRRTTEMLLGLSRFNRRMHGKMWVVDGQLAIIGGRNIGDTYFEALAGGERNSRDIDAAVTGPVLREVEGCFDSFWNLGLSLPVLTLWPKARVSPRAFRRRLYRKTRSDAARAFVARLPHGVLDRPFHTGGQARLIADPPEKAYGHRTSPWIVDRLPQILNEVDRDLRLVTPYFVPGMEGGRILTALAERGVRVEMLTNALCSTDKVVVFGAYGRYRHRLLRAGVRMFEYAPPPRSDGRRDLLHTKLFVMDGRRTLIGSVNYDMRSAFMNTELGLLLDDPALVAEMNREFERITSPAQAYQLVAAGRRHRFLVSRPGLPKEMRADPEAGPALRALSWIAGQLPIQYWL